jgi:hypothetical protein
MIILMMKGSNVRGDEVLFGKTISKISEQVQI